MAGLDRPLLMLRPGLDQPPPGTGEGLREIVIGKPGVPMYVQRRASKQSATESPSAVVRGKHGETSLGGRGVRQGNGNSNTRALYIPEEPQESDIPGIGESWLGWSLLLPAWPPDWEEAWAPSPNDIRRAVPGEADERRRWCDAAGLSSAEDDLPAGGRKGARLTVVGCSRSRGHACLLDSWPSQGREGREKGDPEGGLLV